MQFVIFHFIATTTSKNSTNSATFPSKLWLSPQSQGPTSSAKLMLLNVDEGCTFGLFRFGLVSKLKTHSFYPGFGFAEKALGAFK